MRQCGSMIFHPKGSSIFFPAHMLCERLRLCLEYWSSVVARMQDAEAGSGWWAHHHHEYHRTPNRTTMHGPPHLPRQRRLPRPALPYTAHKGEKTFGRGGQHPQPPGILPAGWKKSVGWTPPPRGQGSRGTRKQEKKAQIQLGCVFQQKF